MWVGVRPLYIIFAAMITSMRRRCDLQDMHLGCGAFRPMLLNSLKRRPVTIPGQNSGNTLTVSSGHFPRGTLDYNSKQVINCILTATRRGSSIILVPGLSIASVTKDQNINCFVGRSCNTSFSR
ncbi:hypothetical protein B0H16DRAFT_1590363 [Mycena metata]|uniref:Uncharacterized protein n=1 Tax=Mycena metata TaxID=1033252 RepID=A0AAD7HSZ3_9AGAR|nr:hypothetical protein B0H16DRAFT_1590363 [Mycena metata]